MTKLLPGVGVALVALGVSFLLHLALPAIPILTAAVVLGIIVGQFPQARGALDGPFKPGLSFSARSLMRTGVVLLGLKLSLGDIAALGVLSILSIVALVIVTFFGTWALGRLMKLPGRESVLIAAGFSICGASAIGAMSSATRSSAEEQATPVALVTLCGTLAIAVLPALQGPLALTGLEFGHWVGASVHDVGQVVATAQTAGSAALAIALVVKLTRVVMLAPMVATASVVFGRIDARTDAARPGGGPITPSKRPPIVPLFVIGFIATTLLNSFVPLPAQLLVAADVAQTIVLGAALFALGTTVRIAKLVRTGWRALIVGLLSWLLIAVLAYFLVFV